MPSLSLARRLCVGSSLGLWLGCLSGCAHFVENRAIDEFNAALQKRDLTELRSATTSEFHQRALRSAEAIDDIEILRLPTDDPTIVNVKDESENEKLVTVTVGKTERKVFYRLTRDNTKAGWQVDDVYLRQRKNGVKVDRSVAEQMDLLLSVREFLDSWGAASGENRLPSDSRALQTVTPELRGILKELPASQVQQLMSRTVKESGRDQRFRPKAQLDSDVAVVTLPRKTGKMILNFKLLDEGWKLSDAAVESRVDRDHIPSLKKTAIAMRTVTRFLDGYHAQDLEKLKETTHKKFFESSLSIANLSAVKLPQSSLQNTDYHVKLESNQADFVIEQPKRVVRLSMARPMNADGNVVEDRYEISEVTLYEPDATAANQIQEKRLSVMFTGEAIFQLFQESLRDGHLDMVRKTSSSNFNERVWNKISPADLVSMTPPIIKAPVTEVLSREFTGAVTKMQVRQGGLKLTYILHDFRGDVRVDDIQVTTDEDVVSMKDTFEVLLPVRAYAKALATGNLDMLGRLSSKDMNRMIWNQTDSVPAVGSKAAEHLLVGMQKFEQVGKDQLMVTLGDEKFGARVLLLEENSRHVIDDVVLINGVQPEQRALLKRTMRTQMAYQVQTPDPNQPESIKPDQNLPGIPANKAKILTAEHAEPAEQPKTLSSPEQKSSAAASSGIQQAGHLEADTLRNKLSQPTTHSVGTVNRPTTAPENVLPQTLLHDEPRLEPADDAFETPPAIQGSSSRSRAADDRTPSPFAGDVLPELPTQVEP